MPLPVEFECRYPLLEAAVQVGGEVTADCIHARHTNEPRNFFRITVSRFVADDRQFRAPGLNQAGILPLLQLSAERRAARSEVLSAVIEARALGSARRAATTRTSRFFQHDDRAPCRGHDASCRKSGPAGADNHSVDAHLLFLRG